MSRADRYRQVLRTLPRDEWDSYLRQASGLPGPRANLELLQAAADEGERDTFRRWIATGDEYLAACGATGLGRLAAGGQHELLSELRQCANDARWRVREGVAMGLQRLGGANMQALLSEMRQWRGGTWLERRAVVAALCEPALLRSADAARAVLAELDAITTTVAETSGQHRKDADFRVLRQALGYGWSVAVAALPSDGMRLFEKWKNVDDADVQWIVRENQKKKRLQALAPPGGT